jgi:hypothetical protein
MHNRSRGTTLCLGLSLIVGLVLSAISAILAVVYYYDSPCITQDMANHVFSIKDDMVIRASIFSTLPNSIDGNEQSKHRRLTTVSEDPHIVREEVWNQLVIMDSLKTGPIYETRSGDERPTLTNFKYFVQPVWWSDQDPNASYMNPDQIQMEWDLASQFYNEMSWGAFTLDYEILPQQVLRNASSVNPGWETETDRLALELVNGQGYLKGKDFNAVCLLYNLARDGPFSGSGGYGNVNGMYLLFLKFKGQSETAEI